MRFDDKHSNTDDVLADARLRSHKFVQIVFCFFTVLFAGLALTAHHAPELLALADAEPRRIADTFLVLAAAYALCLFVWERIYSAKD
ncbi:MAG: hypothetical protein C0519_13770 [Hyphomicrobium sp.]|nr:hypothetical protein [Hyphomicrobium sp.]PPD06722.1 MAG: hypothetical protein CTY28_12135 [Hyphomicrobium sp.]